MPILSPDKYAYFDEQSNQYYASNFWNRLIEILDPIQSEIFQKEYQGKIPLNIMVAYTQEKFLKKQGQRWSLEGYADFDPKIKKPLEDLLSEEKYDQFNEQLMSKYTSVAIFSGGSTANICKRAFYIFDSIVKYNTPLPTVMILGNDEPYDKYMGDIREVVARHPEYFREGVLENIPEKATMHEAMIFVFEHLNWPQGACPIIVKKSMKFPSNAGHEMAAASAHLSENPLQQRVEPAVGQVGLFDPIKPIVTVVSNQPFNDRIGITALNAFSESGLTKRFAIEAAGPGLDTYPLLNTMAASLPDPAIIVDNLTRTLYEIQRDAKNLYSAPQPEPQPLEYGAR